MQVAVVGPDTMATNRSERTLARLAVPFWNASEGRVRALWRIVGALALTLVVPGIVFAATIQNLDLPLVVTGFASNALFAVTTLVVLVAWARYVDRQPVAAYGFRVDRRWLAMLAAGAFVGIAGWGGALATDLIAGWATIEAVVSGGERTLPFAVAFALGVAQFALVGLWEEVVFRGIVMRNAVEGLDFPGVSRRWALVGGWVGSSVLFGALHYDQAGSVLALGFWVLAGLVLGLAHLLTDELAVPIGLHAAFDIGVNHVWGLAMAAPDERVAAIPMLLRPAFTGPERFVGVAGVVNTAWVLVMAVVVIALVWRARGTLRPAFSFREE